MSENLTRLAARLTEGLGSEREKAVRLHDFVRDRVAFGFTRRFDAATPEETLRMRLGHCNPKSALFVAMLRAAGIESLQHFVVIDRGIVRGLLPAAAHRLVPWEISHSYADVRLDGTWQRVDSHVVDEPLWRAAHARLVVEGELLGYGVHRLGTMSWDGKASAFAQLASADMLLEDHGTFEDPVEYYRGEAYRHRLGPVRLDALLGLVNDSLARLAERRLNRHIDQLRASHVVPGELAGAVVRHH